MLIKRILYFIYIAVIALAVINSRVIQAQEILRIATTTSTENSGLLAQLHPRFESIYDAKVQVIAVGTGKALRLAENGDVDIVFVHAPAAEMKFVNNSFGINRTAVMHNDFILLGSKNDPANIKSANTLMAAMSKIAAAKSEFISRGDDSGTHKKEKYLWEKSKTEPKGDWYLSAGQGMGNVLIIAFEKQAYTLSDRGTYLAYKQKIDLEILREGDDVLLNPYHVILVNPEKHPHVNVELATKYIQFITGKEGQKIINDYRIDDEKLFYSDVIKDN
jgi:tungstate transport system substrate-binding protein